MTEPRGDLATALAHTGRLLRTSPAMAEEQAREILRVIPTSAPAHRLLGQALRLQDKAGAALAMLTRAAALDPSSSEGWRALADQRAMMGDSDGANDAYMASLRTAANDPVLIEAAVALGENRLADAEAQLRTFLKRHPTDVAAIRMFAELAIRLGRFGDARSLLERCLELAPGFSAARHNFALVLHRSNQPEAAVAELDRLLAEDGRNPNYLTLKAASLVKIGENDQAIALYDDLLANYPNQPKSWMSYGHALKTVGRLAESIAAYRRALTMEPTLGEVWWSLANLKTYRFDAADMAQMSALLEREDLAIEDHFHLHFALGKALEDASDWQRSFAHYAQGNALRRSEIHYDADDVHQHMERSRALFTPSFFAARTGWGCPDADAIFIVGLPRAGSTLLEQILASHSQVEGTQELPDIAALARRVGGGSRRSEESTYPEALAALTAAEAAALGREYLDRTRVHRKTGRPFFIDKMPNNFAHAGFIHLILPNAKIIDARRHPMGNCFAAFKQHFARGQAFTYDLSELGRYYADYAALMAHMDAVLPGRIHRVNYERMVEDPETGIRALLSWCGLPFEEACLRFYETDRAVRTPSSEQVRQPIFRDAVDQWRHYAPWLGPLALALGPLAEV